MTTTLSPVRHSLTRSLAAVLRERINTRRARIGVIGLGYVGLPLAVEFALQGFAVTGFDVDPDRVSAIQAGRSPIRDVADQDLVQTINEGHLRATTDMSLLGTMDAIDICVPTPLRKTRDPDLSFVVDAVNAVAAHLTRGQLVILESTTYPGTTDDVVRPLLEAGGLTCGEDVFLAFSPERVDPGNQQHRTKSIPKVVGGVNPISTDLAAMLYCATLESVVRVSSPRVAEMVKLLENTFRAVNIGLVNELSMMAHRMGIDVWEVIDAAATKPFGFMPFYPGPGLGGHCIPIDPFYLSWKAREVGFECRFIELAGHVNSAMPSVVVDRVAEALNTRQQSIRGSRVHLFGVAYKRDVSDVRESPSLDVLHLLQERGALVSYTDPYVPTVTHHGHAFTSVPEADIDGSIDCVVICTDHAAFDYEHMPSRFRLVVDTRNALKGRPASNIFRL